MSRGSSVAAGALDARPGSGLTLFLWRHPKAEGVRGRCIGRTDVPVDRRRAKRLAHRIRSHVRRHRLPRVIQTSPLGRCADVGRWLARWGWQHRIDGRLTELDFGAWDGLAWSAIGRTPVDAWCADFFNVKPGGGESLAEMFGRCREFIDTSTAGSTIGCIVGHGGWINAARWLAEHRPLPAAAADWPVAPGTATLTVLTF